MTPPDSTLADHAEAMSAARTALTFTRAAHWDGTEQVLLHRDGRTVFACLVTRRHGSTWFVTECLPQRRDPGSAALLLAVRDRLATESGATDVVTISPGFWGPQLAAGGARTLQRIIPMRLRLDEDLLLLHARSLPAPVQFAPLDTSAEAPARLARMSADDQREGDLIVWREALCGVYGPVITESSLQVRREAELSAAIAITEYLGSPLIAHFVTAAAERGRGRGKALLVESLRRLADCGYAECHLNVVADNWIAHRLYRSIGFTQVGPELLASWFAQGVPGDEP
ncbi:MAG TPA: GNAT family N-acetyltransferase [Streptosporangiaceae bacterium]|jgi:GNAT superfamily N-acetyltransferase